MKRKEMIAATVLTVMLAGGALSGCFATNESGEQTIESLEGMSELEFNKWKLYITLGTKIGANRLLMENTVSEEELKTIATVIETVRDQSIVPGTNYIITPALEDAGFTSDEIQLLLLVVDQELISRGALEWIDPETGVMTLSPRTKEVLTAVASSLRSAAVVTEEEAQMYEA